MYHHQANPTKTSKVPYLILVLFVGVLLFSFKPTKLYLLDQAESPLYDLETELSRKYENFVDFEIPRLFFGKLDPL